MVTSTRPTCKCGRRFPTRQSLSRHKQACPTVLSEIEGNLNILMATSDRRRIQFGEDNNGRDDDLIYDMNEYEVASIVDEADDVIDFNLLSDDFSENDNFSATQSEIEDDDDIYDDLHKDRSDSFEDIFMDDDSNTSSSSSSSSSWLQEGMETEPKIPAYDPPLFATGPSSVSACYKLQVELNKLFDRNKASLSMYDEMIKLFNEYIESPEFNRLSLLQPRRQFIAKSEKMFRIESMAPKYHRVRMTDDTVATVPVFDARTMILSLLHDPTIMRSENFANGYDILSGAELKDDECNSKYGEIHTGDAWLPALTRYCGKNGSYMPVALVVFGDKSHTDLHGALSVEPVSFTLTLFNQSSRNLPQFWRLLGYIPNLSAGKGEANRMSAKDKIQNEHNCLSCVLKSIRDIDERGGIRTTVMGKEVHIKVWIHFIIGDTEGNNKWLGHYPGNNCGISRPYRDCECSFSELSRPHLNCVYTTLREMDRCRTILEGNVTAGIEAFKKISRYPIKNALLEKGLPLSDLIHGPFRMTPPELLHTSGAGLIMYMFKVIADKVGAGINRDDLDKQHVRMIASLTRQSDRNFPRGATRNGIVDGTKCQASERRGNLFSLTCIVHTQDGQLLKECLDMSNEEWRCLLLFLRQYLALEEWFHCNNDKREVTNARHKIGKVLKMMQTLFPRCEGTNGYNIPKMHGMAKMQFYMMLFGSAINFFGGPGESSHKQFVKAPGLKTQRRVSEFACQVAKQYHHVMVCHHAFTKSSGRRAINIDGKNNNFDERIILEGKYTMDITSGGIVESVSTKRLNPKLIRVLERDRHEILETNGIKLTGYTRVRCFDNNGEQSIYYAHPSYRGRPWYDWAFVHFLEREEEYYYPSLILGFIEIDGGVEAVVQCSSRPMKWSTVEKNMFVGFTLGIESESFVRVPLSSFVFTLCVIEDYGGEINKYYVVLPRRGWGGFFGKDIC